MEMQYKLKQRDSLKIRFRKLSKAMDGFCPEAQKSAMKRLEQFAKEIMDIEIELGILN